MVTTRDLQQAAAPSGAGGITTGLEAVPVTLQHGVERLRDLDKRLPSPGLPRANVTCDAEHPEGTYLPPAHMTVMQQHVAFWDRDRDGIITPANTYVGFRRLGFNVFLSSIAIPIIHGTFSYWTGDSWLPDPRFRIFMKNIHRGKHGSDSETYDTEGRFVPQKFEEAFAKYDKGGKGGLLLNEIQDMVRGNRNIMDPVGWSAGWLEWNVLFYMFAKDVGGQRMLHKDDARACIDGTLFYRVAKEVEAGRLKQRQLHGGMDKARGAAPEPAGASRKQD